jgi:hypothetical protein
MESVEARSEKSGGSMDLIVLPLQSTGRRYVITKWLRGANGSREKEQAAKRLVGYDFHQKAVLPSVEVLCDCVFYNCLYVSERHLGKVNHVPPWPSCRISLSNILFFSADDIRVRFMRTPP